MTNVVPFTKNDIPDATRLWNEASEEHTPYTKLTEAEFLARFFSTPHFDEQFMLAAKTEQNELLGFALGYIKKEYLPGETFENTPVYLTMILVKSDHTRRGIGSALLNALQSAAKSIGKNEICITYRNPISLPWLVPGTQAHTHNNAPGVDKSGEAYSFFCKHSFEEQQIELGMYLLLDSFTLPEKYKTKLALLQENGIEVTLYNAAHHHGFEELFTALNGEVWRKTIRENLAQKEPLPIIVAVHNGKIVGFAGPIDKELGGRGWFNGIATHPEYERKGIAFVMFCRLMLEFKAIGAQFSTLFTDAGNPAAGLYTSVGFRVVRQWGVMRKEL